jgi:hypothetical protein
MDATFPTDDPAALTYDVRQVLSPRDKAQETVEQHMKDTSTWVRDGNAWRCVMHTETPVEPR